MRDFPWNSVNRGILMLLSPFVMPTVSWTVKFYYPNPTPSNFPLQAIALFGLITVVSQGKWAVVGYILLDTFNIKFTRPQIVVLALP